MIEPKLTAKQAGQWIMSLEHHVPESICHKPIADIEPPELLRALAGVRALADDGVRVPETLSRVRQRLDAVFEDAIFHRLCNSNPAQAIRRKAPIRGADVQSGLQCGGLHLTPEQIRYTFLA